MREKSVGAQPSSEILLQSLSTQQFICDLAIAILIEIHRPPLSCDYQATKSNADDLAVMQRAYTSSDGPECHTPLKSNLLLHPPLPRECYICQIKAKGGYVAGTSTLDIHSTISRPMPLNLEHRKQTRRIGH